MRKLLLALFFAGWASSAFAAVAVDITGTNVSAGGQNSPVSTYTQNVTSGATGLTCYLMFILTAPGITSVVWDSGGTNQSMTEIGSGVTGTNGSIHVFGLLNPTSGTAKVLQVSWSGGSSRISFTCSSWTGNATASFAATFKNAVTGTGTSTGPSTGAITSATNDAVVGAFLDDGGLNASITINQTQLYNSGNNGRVNAAGTAAGAASVTLTATLPSSSGWDAIGFDIAAPSGGASCGRLPALHAGC